MYYHIESLLVRLVYCTSLPDSASPLHLPDKSGCSPPNMLCAPLLTLPLRTDRLASTLAYMLWAIRDDAAKPLLPSLASGNRWWERERNEPLSWLVSPHNQGLHSRWGIPQGRGFPPKTWCRSPHPTPLPAPCLSVTGRWGGEGKK